MSQWITNGYITVKSHCQKEARLHGGARVNQEHLGEAGFKVNLSIMEPEEAEKFGHSCSAHSKVSYSHHSEEEVHFSWRLESVLMINRREQFPKRAKRQPQ